MVISSSKDQYLSILPRYPESIALYNRAMQKRLRMLKVVTPFFVSLCWQMCKLPISRHKGGAKMLEHSIANDERYKHVCR